VVSASSFEPLKAAEGGPSHVIRSGETIKRPAQPWTGTIHGLLRHLEDVGFAGSPRVVGNGIDVDGNEVLTYVDGSIVHPVGCHVRVTGLACGDAGRAGSVMWWFVRWR
jgi:hypothetical protein